MSETSVIAKWLYGILHGDGTLLGLATGGIWDTHAPQGVTGNVVVFQFQAGKDVLVVGAQRISMDATYLVRAIGATNRYEAIMPIADRIDTLIHGVRSPLVVGGSTLGEVWCVRTQPFLLTEVDSGIEYRHAGGIYRVYAKSA